MPDTSHFFRDLPGFHNFAQQALDNSFYQALPDDWYVIVTDIISSSDAVDNGRYQDVNYVGAASIAALKNALPHLTLPTVFGGDGATAGVPADALPTALEALVATRNWALQAFGLDLRIGAVPMPEIIQRGENVEVGKMDLGQGNELAMFRGAGIELADTLVKDDRPGNPFRADPNATTLSRPDLGTLSCRWSPLAAEYDVMLCVLIEASRQTGQQTGQQSGQQSGQQQDWRDTIYREVLASVNAIVNIDSPAVSPVKPGKLRYSLSPQTIAKEFKTLGGSWFNRLSHVFVMNLIAALSFRFGFRMGSFDPQKYRQELIVNSDYKRINGTIQLVLDCTQEQSRTIESRLQNLFDEGKIVFGLSRSDSALMTCITPDVTNGVHVHYIDGDNGGFWHAARDLKERRSAGMRDNER